MKKKRLYNRLYDTRHRKGLTGIRSDALFEKAIERLVGFGYTGISECVYDCVYKRLNEVSGTHIYPTLEIAQMKEDEADRELELALFALNSLTEDLGVLKA